MSNQKRGLDDFISIVEQGSTKTASAKTEKFNSSLITKLAEELVKGAEGTVPAATAVPAQSSVTETAPTVVAATETIAAP